MDNINGDSTRKVIIRLKVSSIIFVVSLTLSVVTFYYYYATAPIVPLIVGLTGWFPAAIMLMSWHDLRFLKVKKTQQPHYPPHRSQEQKGKR